MSAKTLEVAVYKHVQGPSLTEEGLFIAYPWLGGKCLWLRAYGSTRQEAHDNCVTFVQKELARQKEPAGKPAEVLKSAYKASPATKAVIAAMGGTKWMHKDGVCKRILGTDVDDHLTDGWKLGRK